MEWNSLEAAKLLVSALTPATVAFFTWRLAVWSRRVDNQRDDRVRQQAHQIAQYTKLIEKRVALWDVIGPALNTIYAYELEVGQWQKLTSGKIIERKREADQTFYSYRPFFSDDFARSYDAFMHEAFKTFNPVGEDARLRTSNINHKDKEPHRFTGEANQKAIYDAYYALLTTVAGELATAVSPPPFRATIP